MKLTLFILALLLCIVLFLLIIALFTRKSYAVYREIIINETKSIVFNYVLLLKSQENFAVWFGKDPDMVRGINGTDGTVGAVAYWESKVKEVGKGEQEIKKIDNGSRVDFQLRFKEPFASTSDAYFTTETLSENVTKVRWGFTGKMVYPLNLMLLIMNMDKMVGKDFEQGLTKLKAILESKE